MEGSVHPMPQARNQTRERILIQMEEASEEGVYHIFLSVFSSVPSFLEGIMSRYSWKLIES